MELSKRWPPAGCPRNRASPWAAPKQLTHSRRNPSCRGRAHLYLPRTIPAGFPGRGQAVSRECVRPWSADAGTYTHRERSAAGLLAGSRRGEQPPRTGHTTQAHTVRIRVTRRALATSGSRTRIRRGAWRRRSSSALGLARSRSPGVCATCAAGADGCGYVSS